MNLRGYYAILDVAGPAGASPDAALLLARAERLLAGRPCMLQVRAKAWGAGPLLTLTRALHPLARAAAVPLCVNDRLDVALAAGAEAVHLGQDDLPLAEARRLAHGRLLIGISTHAPDQVRDALAGGADYLGFGPVFPTATKANPDAVVGVAGLRAIAPLAAASGIPVVAIGGITPAQAGAIMTAGASAAALIGAIEGAPDPAAAARAVNAAFGRT